MKSGSNKTITLEEGEHIVGFRCSKDEDNPKALAKFQFVVASVKMSEEGGLIDFRTY